MLHYTPMFVVEVIPLSRKMPFDTLLYTSRESHGIGDLVSAPFQDSAISAVIIAIHELGAVRSHIRTLPYRIKDGIDTVQSGWIPEPICTKLINYAHKNTIPLSNIFQLFWDDSAPIFDLPLSNTHTSLTGAVGSMAERAQHYTQCESALVICPSTEHAKALSSYIPNSTLITTKVQLQKYFKKRATHNKAKVQQETIIIPNILFPKLLPTLPLTTTLIFDGILSPQFQRRTRDGEFWHHALLYINLASWLGYSVIIGDELLQFGDWNTLWKSVSTYTLPAPTIASEAVQTKHKKKRTLEAHHLGQLSNQALSGKKVLIFCNQRDLFGYVCCPKCHYIERCDTCNGVVRLVIDDAKHALECTTCSTRTRPRDICRSCGGITLESRRQGIQGYAQKLAEIAPRISVMTLTKETMQSASVVRDWSEHGGILITTSTIFAYPHIQSDVVYIAPHTWTTVPDTPEEHLYEYAWLLHHTKSVVSLPITRELLTQSTGLDVIDIHARAEVEYASAEHYNLQLSCTIL